LLIPSEAAITRLDKPFSNFSRSKSRMRRIDNLSLGIRALAE